MIAALAYLIAIEKPDSLSIKYWGGPVEHNPNIRLIYWGPKWQGGNLNPIKAAVARFFRLLPGSNYQNVTAQYRDKTGKVGLDPKLVATYIDPISPSGRITRTGVGTEVVRVAALKGWPSGVNQQYIVLGQPREKTDDASNQDCGYHEWGSRGNATYVYDFIPFEGDCLHNDHTRSVVSNTLIAVSHESAEAMTDPLDSGWKDSQSNEIADYCTSDNNTGMVTPDGSVMAVNGLWDMTHNRCTTDLPRAVGEKLTVVSAGSHSRVYNVVARVQIPVLIPGETTIVFLSGDGYTLRRIHIAPTAECTPENPSLGPGSFEYQFNCHSRTIEITASAHTTKSDISGIKRDAYLNVWVQRNGYRPDLQLPPQACTDLTVWQPGSGPSPAPARKASQPVKCL